MFAWLTKFFEATPFFRELWKDLKDWLTKRRVEKAHKQYASKIKKWEDYIESRIRGDSNSNDGGMR